MEKKKKVKGQELADVSGGISAKEMMEEAKKFEPYKTHEYKTKVDEEDKGNFIAKELFNHELPEK